MSASPAERTPGRTPNGTLPPLRRPRPAADPMVRPRQRRPAKPPGAPAPVTQSLPQRNGTLAPPARPLGPGHGPAPVQVAPGLAARPAQIKNPAHHDATRDLLNFTETIPSGFSSQPVAPYQDYPLMMSVRQLKEGLRNHVARFYSKKTVDPANEKEFVRPVRLLRRDQASIGQEARTTPGDVEMDADEREKNQQAKALREAEREAQMKEVAPSAATAQRRLGPMKKKTTQVWQHDQTEADRAKSKIAYEEKLKWNLEDFEGKQNWVGSYEAALSQTYASIVMKDGRFEIVPVEKWYKFTPRQNFKALDLEQAEKHLVKRVKAEPEWLKNANEQQKLKREEDNNRKATRKLFVGAIKDEPEIGGSKEDGGLDEIDFEEDRFADDEEPDLFEGDPDELKQQEKRIKADQLQANVFDMKAEQDYDQAEALEKKEKQRQKELGKRVKKALMKRERNYIYDSDEENPYSDKSETTDSEAEREKEEQEKKEAEEKAKANANASGTSTKGSNTPSNRASKHGDRSKARSANDTDASGNESSRKVAKKNEASRLGTGTNTPNGANSRSRSPAPPSGSQDGRKSAAARVASDSLKKRPRAPGSGSDGEGAGSGGEMSDGSRKRLKMNGPNPKANPASALGSPGASRSGSIEPTGRAGSPIEAKLPPLPTIAELANAIPDSGIPMVKLFKMYGGQHPARKDELLKMLRPISKYDKATKMLKKTVPKV